MSAIFSSGFLVFALVWPFWEDLKGIARAWDPGHIGTLYIIIMLLGEFAYELLAFVVTSQRAHAQFVNPPVFKRSCGARARRLLRRLRGRLGCWGPGPTKTNGISFKTMWRRWLASRRAWQARWSGGRRTPWSRCVRFRIRRPSWRPPGRRRARSHWHTRLCLLQWPALKINRLDSGSTGSVCSPASPSSVRDADRIHEQPLRHVPAVQFVRGPRLSGGAAGDGGDLLEGLRALLQENQGHRARPQEDSLLKGLKALVNKATKDKSTDLLSEMAKLVEQETKRREKLSKKNTSSGISPPCDRPPQRSPSERWQSDRPAPGSWPPSKQTEWQDIRWVPRLADWTHPLTEDIQMIRGPDEFADHLENHKGEAHVVLVDSKEQFDEVVQLASAERNPMVQVVLPCSTHLDEGIALRIRVPGVLRGAVQSRWCWTKTVGEGPELKARHTVVSDNLRKKCVTVPEKGASRGRNRPNAGYVIRMMAPLSFQSCSWHQWNTLTQQPGTFARQWATRVLPGCSSHLGDTFKFEIQDQQLRGLIRVFKLDVALQLVKLSGSLDPSDRAFRWFVQGVSPETVEPHSVAWMPWNDEESWTDYMNRVRQQDSMGVVAGSHQLGLRVRQGDPRLQSKPAVWLLDRVPSGWQPQDVLELLMELMFSDVELMEKTWSRVGTTWKFRATRTDAQSVVQGVIAAEDGDALEMTATKAAITKKSKGRAQPLRQERRVSYAATGQSVTDAGSSKTFGPALQSEADEDMLDTDRHHKKPKAHDAETEADEDAAMAAEPKPTSDSKWQNWLPPEGRRVSNTGKGDCLMLALASGMNHVEPGKKSYSGRQMRQFLVAWMRKHYTEYECLWDGRGPGKDAEKLQDFQTYLDKVAMAGTWCGFLECIAASHALRRSIFVLTKAGECWHYEHEQIAPPLSLYYDEEVGHYEELQADKSKHVSMIDRLRSFAKRHQGARHSGGALEKEGSPTQASPRTSRGSLCLEDFASDQGSRSPGETGSRNPITCPSSCAEVSPVDRGAGSSFPFGSPKHPRSSAGPERAPNGVVQSATPHTTPQLDDFASVAAFSLSQSDDLHLEDFASEGPSQSRFSCSPAVSERAKSVWSSVAPRRCRCKSACCSAPAALGVGVPRSSSPFGFPKHPHSSAGPECAPKSIAASMSVDAVRASAPSESSAPARASSSVAGDARVSAAKPHRLLHLEDFASEASTRSKRPRPRCESEQHAKDAPAGGAGKSKNGAKSKRAKGASADDEVQRAPRGKVSKFPFIDGRFHAECPHCPLVFAYANCKQVAANRYHHIRRHHDNVQPPVAQKRRPLVRLLSRHTDDDGLRLLWKCPVSNCGRGFFAQGSETFSKWELLESRREHRKLLHSKIPVAKWNHMCRRTPLKAPSQRHKRRIQQLNTSASAKGCLRDLLSKNISGFMFPVITWRDDRKRLKVIRAWWCKSCGVMFKLVSKATKHQCTRKPGRRLKTLASLREAELWCEKHSDHGFEPDSLRQIFESARHILEGKAMTQ